MLRPLLRKELKELFMERTILIGVIIIPLIIFPLMGGLTSLGMRAAVQQTLAEEEIGLINLDEEGLADDLTALLREKGLHTIELRCLELEECVKHAQERGVKAILIIPRGFAENLTQGVRGMVKTMYFIDSLSFSELALCDRISSSLKAAFRSLAEMVHGGEIDLEFFKEPMSERSKIVYAGRIIEAPIKALAALAPMAIFGIPLAVVMVSGYASSIAATSIALEKESKTLELLLTLPARRMTILLSKLLGTLLIVLLGTISFMIGFGIYGLMIAGAMIPPGEGFELEYSRVQLQSLIQPSPILIPVIVSATFLAMILTACIGILVGVLCGDVRSAQQLVGAVIFPLLMPPFLILMFASFNSLPLGVRAALLLDPYTHLFLSIQGGSVGDLSLALSSIGAMAIYMIALLAVSSWLFMGEKLVTARIRLRRKAMEE